MPRLACPNPSCDHLIEIPAQISTPAPAACTACHAPLRVPPPPAALLPSLSTPCVKCGKHIDTPLNQAGKKIECPHCQAKNFIPPLGDGAEGERAAELARWAAQANESYGNRQGCGCLTSMIGVFTITPLLMGAVSGNGFIMFVILGLCLYGIPVVTMKLFHKPLAKRCRQDITTMRAKSGGQVVPWFLGLLELDKGLVKALGALVHQAKTDAVEGPLAVSAQGLLGFGATTRRQSLLRRAVRMRGRRSDDLILQLALVDQDLEVRLQAMAELPHRDQARSVPALASIAFHSEDPRVVAAAIQALGHDDLIATGAPVLVDLLLSPDFDHHDTLIAELLAGITHPDPTLVRRVSARAGEVPESLLAAWMPDLEGVDVVELLKRELLAGKAVPTHLISALAGRPAAEILAGLAPLLESTDVRGKARINLIAVLAGLNGDDAARLVADEAGRCESGHHDRLAAILAAGGPAALAGLQVLIRSSEDAAEIRRLAKIIAARGHDPDLAVLSALIRDETAHVTHVAALEALASMDRPTVLAELTGALDLSHMAKDRPRLIGLIAGRGTVALPVLANIFDRDDLAEVRPFAARALATAEGMPLLVERLGKDVPAVGRTAVMEALRGLSDDDAIAAAVQAIRNGEDLRRDSDLIFALAATRSGPAHGGLLALLDDPAHACLQPVVVAALAQHGNQDLIEEFLLKLDAQQPERNRLLIQAVAGFPSATVAEWLTDLATSGTWSLANRQQALEALPRLTGQAGLVMPRLEKLAQDRSAAAVFATLLSVAQAIGGPHLPAVLRALVGNAEYAPTLNSALAGLLQHPERESVPVFISSLGRPILAQCHPAILTCLCAIPAEDALRPLLMPTIRILLDDETRRSLWPMAAAVVALWAGAEDAAWLNERLADRRHHDLARCYLAALSRLGDAGAIEGLLSRWQSARGTGERERLLTAILASRDPRSLPVATQALADRRLASSWTAVIEALAHLPSNETTALLGQVLGSRRPDAVHRTALTVLGRSTDAAASEVLATVAKNRHADRERRAAALAGIPAGPAGSRLAADLLADDHARPLHALAVARLLADPDPASVAFVETVLADDDLARKHGQTIVAGLAARHAETDLRLLGRILRDGRHRRLHRQIIERLADLGGTIVVEELLSVLDESHRPLHQPVLEALQHLGSPEVSAALALLLDDPAKRRLHRRIREMLGRQAA